MKTLETQRLLLSAWRKKDAADLYEYAKNPNVGPHAGWKPHGDVKESRQIIKTLFIPNGVWAIRDRESGRAIGTISLEEDKYRPGIRSRELGYSLSEEYWGRGLMTEAAKEVIRYGLSLIHISPVLFLLSTLPFIIAEGMIRALGMVVLLEQYSHVAGAASAMINFILNIVGTVGASLATLNWNSYITALAVICIGCMAAALLLWIVIIRKGIMEERLFGRSGR